MSCYTLKIETTEMGIDLTETDFNGKTLAQVEARGRMISDLIFRETRMPSYPQNFSARANSDLASLKTALATTVEFAA